VKYVALIPDGAADYALDEFDRQTPLEAAHTPHMDRIAREGTGGLVQIIPPERPPGSDVGNLEIFGYDTRVHYTGRAPLEAASMGIDLGPGDIAFRCNLITCDGDTLVDYSAGHISSEEAEQLIRLLAESLRSDGIRFYPGVSYRHLMVYQGGPDNLNSYPPHDIMGMSMAEHLPQGEGSEEILALMEAATPLLRDTEVNAKRVEAGMAPANGIWLWGSGAALTLQSLRHRFDLRGGVISAVDLVRGIGRCAGLEVIEVPGITGYLDTNYAGKADYALAALDEMDFVYVHVEAPDEAGHNADAAAKKQALEDFDRLVVGRVLDGLGDLGEPVRILLTPDHRTPIALRTHSREPVPFALWGEGIEPDAVQAYNETAAAEGELKLDHGHRLMELLVESSRSEGRGDEG